MKKYIEKIIKKYRIKKWIGKKYIGQRVIVRGIQSGVYYGTLADRAGQEAELTDCRNIWYWQGANNLHQLSAEGVNPEGSKISMAVESIVLTDICEIIPCTKEAVACIDGVKEWKY